jgi:hypothetical protein
MRSEVTATLLVIVVIAGAGVGYVVGNANEHATTVYSNIPFNHTITLYTSATSTSASTTCTNPPFIGCVPIDVPVILGASVNESTAATTPANCGIVTQGYEQSVVCQIEPSPGTSGTIMLNMTSQNGNSSVAFGLYSSSQYIQFESAYSCLYSSSPPDYNTFRCPVSGSGSTYRFDYTVSQTFPSQTEAVLTIVVTKTCCFP